MAAIARGWCVLLELSAFAQLALSCAPAVASETLAAVARTESGFNPLAVHDNATGRSFAPASAAEAEGLASVLITTGHSVDVGLMQVNSANFPALGLTIAQAFDPCASLAAGAKVLVRAYRGGATDDAQQQAIRVALSRYNTGDPDRGFTNGYVRKVEASAVQVVPAIRALPAQTGDMRAATPPVSAPAPDPNAPPTWDVWASEGYAAGHHRAQWLVTPEQPVPAAAPATAAPPPDAPDSRGTSSAIALHASASPLETP